MARVEKTPALHHINGKIHREIAQQLARNEHSEGGYGMEVILEQLYRGAKAYYGLNLDDHDYNAPAQLSYLWQPGTAAVRLRQNLLAGYELLAENTVRLQVTDATYRRLQSEL